jgi:hypothetical protein
MLRLIEWCGGDAKDVEVSPNLWAGIGLVRLRRDGLVDLTTGVPRKLASVGA